MVRMGAARGGEVSKGQALAAALRVARELAKLTQEEAGAAIEVSRQTINAYERGVAGPEPDASTVAALASAYGVPAQRITAIAAAIAGDDSAALDEASHAAGIQFAVSVMSETLARLRAKINEEPFEAATAAKSEVAAVPVGHHGREDRSASGRTPQGQAEALRSRGRPRASGR